MMFVLVIFPATSPDRYRGWYIRPKYVATFGAVLYPEQCSNTTFGNSFATAMVGSMNPKLVVEATAQPSSMSGSIRPGQAPSETLST